MSAKQYKKLNYLMIFVKMFADKFGLTERQAFNYLDAHKGFAFVDKHYDAIHTMDFAYAIQDVQEVCQANGGLLKSRLSPTGDTDIDNLYSDFEQEFLQGS